MSIEVMRQALEVLEQINQLSIGENAIALPGEIDAAMDNLRAAIEQGEKPVAWVCEGISSDEKHSIDYQQEDIDALPVGTMLYTTPPAAPRQWVGLTDQEIEDDWERVTGHSILGGNRSDGRTMFLSPDEVVHYTQSIEAKLKEKNA
jgi:hypothetical protein